MTFALWIKKYDIADSSAFWAQSANPDGVANGEEGRVGHSGALRPEAIVRPIEGDGRICHEVSADRLDETSDANMPPGAAGV